MIHKITDNVKLINLRNKQTFEGPIVEGKICVGKPFNINCSPTHVYYVSTLQRILKYNNTYYLMDRKGIPYCIKAI